jgi:hypothetical protein
MNYGLSEQVRTVALERYVQPAIRSGKTRFSVVVRDLMTELRLQGFPERNWPQVCSAIQAEKFLRANGLEIEEVEGPPSKMSPTVVVRYRVKTKNCGSLSTPVEEHFSQSSNTEAPASRALRLAESLRGILKDELAEYGGGEAFLRWVRSEDEDAA